MTKKCGNVLSDITDVFLPEYTNPIKRNINGLSLIHT